MQLQALVICSDQMQPLTKDHLTFRLRPKAVVGANVHALGKLWRLANSQLYKEIDFNI